MILKILTCFAFILFFLTSCIKEIPYTPKTSNSRSINISGQFTDTYENQIVTIRETANLDKDASVIGDPIEFADVSVVNQNGDVFGFTYLGKGTYGSFTKGEVGHSYKLVVVLEDGRLYESGFHTLIKGSPIEAINLEHYIESFVNINGVVNEQERVKINLTSLLNNGSTPIYTLYRISGEYEFQELDFRISPPLRTCFITQNFDAGNIVSLSGFDLPNNEIKQKTILSTLYDYRFELNFSAHVTQFSVDSLTYAYWNKIERLTNIESTLFDPPPGRITGNIRSSIGENVFGYFIVGSKTEKRAFTNSRTFANPVVNICRVRRTRRPVQCINCLRLANSTTVKPPYWPI